MKRTRWLWLPVAGLALWLPACAQKSDVEAVQATQKEILAKLEKMDKNQATILARVQGAQPAAARPQADPNQIYQIPIASSQVRGPKDAPVTIVEFSDFQ